MKKPLILVVDDDVDSLSSTAKILSMEGYRVETAGDGQEALGKLQRAPVDIVITDLRMPRMGGMDFLKALHLFRREIPVVMMTAFGTIEDAVWAMKHGVVDFLTKPFKRGTLLQSVQLAAQRLSKTEKVEAASLIGISASMNDLRGLIAKVAPTESTVLIMGESGSGKERVARMIHQGSRRATAPFVALNCAAIPENLMESELFGSEKGAYSGANEARRGLIEAAQGGTLFLDEIGDLPLALQGKLLRVIQEGEYRRLGSTRASQANVRFISATHRDLREEVKRGCFREDLLFRLDVVALSIVPLRDRMEDFPLLVTHFLGEVAEKHRRPCPALTEGAMQCLQRHFWPGNVRELANVLERAVILSSGVQIDVGDPPPHLRESGSGDGQRVSVPVGTPLKEMEDLMIQRTLDATGGDKNMTAKLLGINSRTIYRKLEKRPSLK